MGAKQTARPHEPAAPQLTPIPVAPPRNRPMRYFVRRADHGRRGPAWAASRATDPAPPATLKPVASAQTGLLRQPPLDLPELTLPAFEAFGATVGPGRVRRPWTVAITPLPPHPRPTPRGLSPTEVRAYMRDVRTRFDRGAAAPVSDVGLISTQEEVNRKPMYNHIAAFTNATANVYLLVQRLADGQPSGWGYFSIVQDKTTDPPTDYYAELTGTEVKFEGANCYKCHSSGPLALHPVRADLVSDVPLLRAINAHIIAQPPSTFYFPPTDPKPALGEPLALAACTKCHDTGGDRGPLYRLHAQPNPGADRLRSHATQSPAHARRTGRTKSLVG